MATALGSELTIVESYIGKPPFLLSMSSGRLSSSPRSGMVLSEPPGTLDAITATARRYGKWSLEGQDSRFRGRGYNV